MEQYINHNINNSSYLARGFMKAAHSGRWDLCQHILKTPVNHIQDRIFNIPYNTVYSYTSGLFLNKKFWNKTRMHSWLGKNEFALTITNSRTHHQGRNWLLCNECVVQNPLGGTRLILFEKYLSNKFSDWLQCQNSQPVPPNILDMNQSKTGQHKLL